MKKAPVLDYIAEGLRELAVPIGEIRQDPNNVRLHSDENLRAIAASYRRFGQRKPIVVNRKTGGVTVAGNGQLQAARDILGWTHIAVLYVDDDDETATAFAISDNRTAELATWHDERLLEQLDSLQDDELRDATGFTEADVDELRVIEQLWGDGEVPQPSDGVRVGLDPEAATVKIVIAVPDVPTVEQALRATGEIKRGSALVKVCEEYLRAQSRQTV